MGVVRVTPHPQHYNDFGMDKRLLLRENADSSFSPESDFTTIRRIEAHAVTSAAPAKPSKVDKFQLQFGVKAGWSERTAQRRVACRIAEAIGVKQVYHKGTEHTAYDYGYYTVGEWSVWGYRVTSGWFAVEELPEMLRIIDTLPMKGYSPMDDMAICYAPARYDIDLVRNLCIIMEARRALIQKALCFEEDFRITLYPEYMTFSYELGVFSTPTIEAMAHLLRQGVLTGTATKKARMKPCDMSNPRYQMRSWLLRLGFIGDTFERPRQTLLNRLEGDSAFFDEESKRKGEAKKTERRLREKALQLV